MACSDQSTCSVDRCVESTRSCEHELRDADADGDAVWNCGGSDCDDARPQVNGSAPEVCANDVDDDCDRAVDESDCVSPAHDGCVDALVVDASGTYELSLEAARQDFALSCVEPDLGRRDVVVALTVPDGPALEVDVTAHAIDAGLALGLAGSCSNKASELSCAGASPPPEGLGHVARLTAHALTPGVYPLFVSGLYDEPVDLKVSYAAATTPPTNETCGTAAELVPNQAVLARLTASQLDLTSACKGALGELVYRFDLQTPADVVLSAIPLDTNGAPTLSLRNEGCVSAKSELDCRSGTPARLFARALPAGTYYVAVGATGPSDIELRLNVKAPSEPPPDEGCAAPPLLTAGLTQDLELNEHQNTFQSQCLPGAVDATYALELPTRSDVLLVERLSVGDTGAVSLLAAGCDSKTSLLCTSSSARAYCTCSPWNGAVCSDSAPVRARAYDVVPGRYAVVVESAYGSPAQITAFTRPARPATLVALSDTCADALEIPEAGGRFTGTTTNANPDYSASCDFGVGAAAGAPDQMLKMHLSETRRVILDAGGSDYATLVAVRSAADCPGREIERACAPGCSAGRSFLDVVLPKGDYHVQVDGYVGASGHWVLDVFFGEPPPP